MRRRIVSVALIGLAIAGATTVAAAQGSDAPRAGRAGAIRGGIGRIGSDTLRAGRGRGRGGAKGRAALAGINLTSAQKANIKVIHQRYADQFKQLRQAGAKADGRNPQLRPQIKALAERERGEVRNVLTPDQRIQFDANMAKLKAGHEKTGLSSTRARV